ncbi:TonB-dependent siderophore receptor [Pseudochelatococcus sp. B33]
MLSLMMTTAIVTIGVAYPVSADAQTAATGQASRTSLDIPAQPLSRALVQFSNATGAQLFFDANLVRGKNAPAVRGSLTRSEALGQLLAGSGLVYRVSGNTVTITSSAGANVGVGVDDGSLVLDTITVEGQSGSVFGGEGYVATRSTAGTKTDTDLIRTPQTVNVVKREQIEAQGAQSIGAALRFTPGVRSELYGAETTPRASVMLRGFILESGAYYLNGLKQQYASSLDPYLLEGIEVIKGPASVLYGQASPGGVVNIVSKLPTETPVREIQMLGGYPGQAQFGFDFGGPIDDEGRFLYRLTGVAYDRNTHVDFAKGQRIAIAPAFTWKPDKDTNLTLYGVYQHDPKIVNYYPLPAAGTVLPNPNGRIPRSRFVGEPDFNRTDSTTARIGYNFEHRFSESVMLRSSSSYGKYEFNNRLIEPLCVPGPPDYRVVCRWATNQQFDSNVFATDNRLQFDFDTGPLRHKLIAGFDYQYRDLKSSIKSDYGAPPIDLFNPVYAGVAFNPTSVSLSKQHQSQLGIYAQDQIEFGRLNFLIGGRQDWATSKTRNALTGAITGDKDDDAFTWRTGAIYNFDNGIAPYASYSESFEPVAGVDYFQQPYKPTTGQQYEVGIKYQPPGLDSFITLAAYEITQQNRLTRDTRPGVPGGFNTQTGEIRSRGIEVSAVAKVLDNLSLVGGYTYNHSEITKSENNDIGNIPWGTPKHTASMWADYKFMNGTLDGFGIGGGVRYVGKTYGDSGNTFEVPSFTLVDAAVHYEFGSLDAKLDGLRLSVNASNLFDKRYVSSCSYNGFCVYGAGREVTARLTYRW